MIDLTVPGEKRGKGIQHLNSSYWMTDLASFIGKNISTLQKMLKTACEREDAYQFLLNQCNFYFTKAENGGLKTQQSKDFFLLSSWLCMASAEMDDYGYSKYSEEERK